MLELDYMKEDVGGLKKEYYKNKKEEIQIENDHRIGDDQRENYLTGICQDKMVILKGLTRNVNLYNDCIKALDIEAVNPNE